MGAVRLVLGTPGRRAPPARLPPAHRAAVEIAENASWADVPWEATDPLVVKEQGIGVGEPGNSRWR
ncbi:hypothetical protein GCM10022224_091080 [Nonomuraea antimicrobica]|uniref:Uncharacterized protein n=1 Tax=Nonomuraea antimicrobica TaxID=561173 RepID=A0ABP7DXC9_9ACTN